MPIVKNYLNNFDELVTEVRSELNLKDSRSQWCVCCLCPVSFAWVFRVGFDYIKAIEIIRTPLLTTIVHRFFVRIIPFSMIFSANAHVPRGPSGSGSTMHSNFTSLQHSFVIGSLVNFFASWAQLYRATS